MDYGALEKIFGEPVTTSVTGAPQRQSDVPTDMEIITADDIRRSGSLDIPGILEHVAGIDVMRWAADQADVGVRGYDQAYTPRMLVLIDGRQVYADYQGFVPWSTLPVELNAIRQIEIVKGPNSALYGFNAVGGVINIITTNPQTDDVGAFSLSGGTQDAINASAVKTWQFSDRASLRLSAGYKRENEFMTPIPPTEASFSRRPGNERIAFSGLGTVRLMNNVELSLDVSHTQVGQNEISPLYIYTYDQYQVDSVKTGITADTDLGMLQFTAYSNWLGQKINGALPGTVIDFRNHVSVVQAQDVFQIGNDHTVRLSMEYRHNAMPTSPFEGAVVSYDVESAGAMWNWDIVQGVSLSNAVRLDNFTLARNGAIPAGAPLTNADWDRTLSAGTFNSGLVWHADDENTIRLTAARGVQLPSLADFGGVVAQVGPAVVSGFPTIRPTVVMNYEAGWDRTISTLHSQVRFSVFHQENTDLTSPQGGVLAGPTGVVLGGTNIGSSNANGFEAALHGAAEAWRWGLSDRYEKIKDNFIPQARGGVDLIDYQDVTPTHLVKANIGWTDQSFEADLYLNYQTATQGIEPTGTELGITHLVPVGAYVGTDARIAYQVSPTTTLALSGQNLLTARQRQTSGPNVERQVFLTLNMAP